MKIKSIVVALAAVLAAPIAMAQDLSTLGIPANNVIYMAGASAQTPGLAKTLTGFCNSPIETYSGFGSATNNFVYYCSSAKATSTSGVSTGFTATSKFAVLKVDQGGSFNGVAAVSPTSALPASYPKFPTLVCNSTPNSAVSAAVIAGSNVGTCTLEAANNVRPQLGLTDVPKSIWSGRGQLSAADDANLKTVSGFAGQGFGVAVSAQLYAALQADQGLASTVQPSLSANQYASLVQAGADGQVWDILLPNAAKANAAGTALPAGIAAWPPAAQLTLHRRQATSGTQASSDVYFLNNPCESGTSLGGAFTPTAGNATADAAAIYPDTTYASAVNFLVNERSSTGNVRTGLAAAGYAIGVLSLENPEAGIGGGAKYVKINGVSPTADTLQKANLVNGSYDFAFELEIILAKTAAANINSFANALGKELGNGNVGFAGLYSDPNAGTLVEGETNHYTRSNNACQKARWFW